MIRINGGRFQGKSLFVSKDGSIRPTTGLVRKSLFGILSNRLEGARVLDLFAGSGVVGLEALGWGASYVESVEQNFDHCRILEKNRLSLDVSAEVYKIRCRDVWQWLIQTTEGPFEPFDIVFMDPPYLFDLVEPLIEAFIARKILSEFGILICEHSSKTTLAPTNATLLETREYGDSALSFFTYMD